MDQLESLVQACLEQEGDESQRQILNDWLADRGESHTTRERLTPRWPGEDQGRWYWWRQTMTREIASVSAKLPAQIYDLLPPGPNKGPEVSHYNSPLDAFQALLAALLAG